MEKLRLGIIGCGFLGNIIAKAWKDGLLPEYELVGVVSRSKESAERTARMAGCAACAGVKELLALRPDYVAEAASVQTVRDHAEEILEAWASFVVLSIGAFADRDFYERVRGTALRTGRKIHIASGAIGGFDVLRTVFLMGQGSSGIATRKGPASLKGTPVFEESLMTDTEEKEVFSGCAKEAIGLFPTKVNVAVAASLATAGPEHTDVSITSVPGFVGDDHRITAQTDGVTAVVDVYSSTSAIAGWSVVALLQNLVSPVMF